MKGPDRGETIAIAEAPLTLGSGGGCDVLLSDPTISRKHLGSSPARQGVVLRDLGSTNGSFVQGSRFKEMTLGFGTEVTIGKTVLKFLPDEEEVEPGAVGAGELRLAGRARPQAAAAVPAARRRRRDRRDRADRGRDRHRQGAARRGDPPPQRRARTARSSCSTAARSRDELIESELFGHVRGRVHRRDHRSPRAPSRRPTAARCSSTRSASCRSSCSRSCCARSTSSAVRPVGGSTLRRERRRARRRGHQPRPARRGRRASRFREDLYYRLAVVRMSRAAAARAPRRHPAAGRSTSCASSAATARCEVAREDLERLRRHDWPGNVRELRNVIERACARQPRRSAGARRRARRAARRRRRWRAAVDVDLPFKEAKAQLVEQLRARVHRRRCSSATRGTCRPRRASARDRSQAPARAAAQARAARVGRHVT